MIRRDSGADSNSLDERRRQQARAAWLDSRPGNERCFRGFDSASRVTCSRFPRPEGSLPRGVFRLGGQVRPPLPIRWDDVGAILRDRPLARADRYVRPYRYVGTTLGRRWDDVGATLGRCWGDVGATLGRSCVIALSLGRTDTSAPTDTLGRRWDDVGTMLGRSCVIALSPSRPLARADRYVRPYR
jgi:hypothetical protein